ncbi:MULTISPECIES: DUF802 domain-containing protein [Amycolatopsis]|uniref:DUF802 domain-containing protein n=1 Tax=Amycolatopsis saalfeldensis TaxID=394193 RepID=A0A1H8YPF5_9PSEU|nr:MULTISPECIES: DUF802 domain-containing protein [Amycolatopsis]SEP54050.1 hypothetical protein SAMN04489732_1367 [Amycolatopsis saalfeldensis]
MSTPDFLISWTFMQSFEMTLTVDEARELFVPDPLAKGRMVAQLWEAACSRQQAATDATAQQLREMLHENPEVLSEPLCTFEHDDVDHTRRIDSIEIIG